VLAVGLGGDWAGSEQRCMEVSVPNEQTVEDMRLPIKLSYSDSYAHDEGRLLLLDTRLRLGVLADGFEFAEALEQVVKSLALENHPGMAAVRRKAVGLLTKGIKERVGEEDEEDEEIVKLAVDALAKCLGPVAVMFVVGIIEYPLALREDVKQLPLCATTT
jgi:hypothetical protein